MNPNKNPCYGCEPPERHIGCHSTCEKYKKRTAERISEKVAIKRQTLADRYTAAQVRESYFGKVEYRTRDSRRKRGK